MIAAFPMYDRPETAEAHDRLWAEVRSRIDEGPDELTRAFDDDLFGLWEHKELLLGISCGLPLRERLAGKVTLVGSLVNDLPGCPRGHYFSQIVISAREEPRPLPTYAHARFAFNQAHSQSGWAAAQNHAAELGFRFENVIETGAHRESARAIVEGRAEIAMIDAVSWALISEHDDFAAELQVIGATEPTPGEPVLTAPGHDAPTLAAALAGAIAALSAQDRTTLHLVGLATPDEVPLTAYLAVPTPPSPYATTPGFAASATTIR